MTQDKGQVPAIQRFEVVDCIDSKHVPAVIPNKDGPWVRYEDHAAVITALRTQQPAPATQQAGEVSESQVWRCFHCEGVFTDKDSAALHFGSSERQQAYCTIPVEHFRWMEEQQRRYFEEDTESHRTIRALHSQSFENARRSEERGYARGLEDAKKHPQELGLMAAPQPSPTAQAGVPAPVLDSLALMKVVMQADEALSGRCTRGTTNWAAAIGKAVQDAVLAARAPADSVLEDAARLDWLLLHISGAEFRRIGVHYSGNARRADVDAARKQGAGSKP